MNASDPRATATSPPQRAAWRRRALIGTAALGVIVAVYAAAGFWLAPRIVAEKLPALLAERYGLKLTLGPLRLNPFRFDFEADDISLRGPDGAPLLQAGRLAIDCAPTGLLHGRWTFDSVRLAALQVNLVVAKDGTLNLVDLLHRFAGPASAPAAAPPRVVVDRLDLAGAALAVTDLRGDAPATAKIAPIDLSLTGLSTLPDQKTTQTLAATLPDGATLRSQGELVLEPALRANGRFDLKGLQAARWAPFLGSLLRIDRLQGGIDLSARYAYAADLGLRLDDIGLHITDLLLAATGVSSPLIALKKVDVSGGTLDLNARQVALAKVSLAHGTASVAIAADGRVGWSRLVPPAPAGAASNVAGPAWQVSAAAVALDQVGLDYTDRQHAPPWAATVAAVDGSLKLGVRTGAAPGVTAADLALRVQGIALPAADAGGPALTLDSLAVEGGAFDLAARSVTARSVSIEGGNVAAARDADGTIDWVRRYALPAPARSMPQPSAASAPSPAWDVRIAALRLRKMAVHWLDRGRPAPLRLDVGQVDLGLALQATTGGGGPQVAAQGVQASVKDLAVEVGAGQPPALALASASLSDGHFDLAARRFGAARLALSGGSTRVVRDAKGRIELLDAIGAAPASASATALAAPWQYAVDKVVLQGFGLAARDRSTSPPLALDAQLDATVDRLASTGPATFDATLALARGGGSVKATGTVTPATGSTRARVVAAGLDLTPLQPLLARYTTLQLGSGRAGSDVTLTYAPGATDALQVTGAASLENLALDEAGSATHFLSFDRLDATKLAFASGGPRLEIGELDIARPDARIAIAKDRRVNFAQVVKRSADAAPPSPAAPGSAPAFGVSVQQVRLHDAHVDFSDQSLVLPFATRVEGIDATLVGLSNDPARRADVQARGRIEPYGSASVDGNIVPAEPRRHTDLTVKFNNVTLQPFSPYTATFAGRKVQSGKLWLDLGYKIDDGELLGRNDIRLSQFTLGEPVESPTALNLPLNLAVSLLTDSKGEINLSVPVRGDLDNPRFSVGDAIGQAVKNTLGRIVSAPFRLIGRLFGSDGGESLARIDFGAGSAELGPEQREKLDTLAKALAERPLLQLVVGAPYDAAADTLALQRAAARRRLALTLGQGPAEGGSESLVAFDDPATRKALRSLAAQSGSAVAEPAADDRAAFEAMFDRIARQQSLGADSPQILATRRAGTIAKYLGERGIDRNRVRTGAVEAVAADGDGSVDAALTVSAAGAAS